MIWGTLQYFVFMVPVIVTAIRDLIWEELSTKEIRTHYLFGKAQAYDRANFWKRAVRVYEEILRQEPNSIPVLLNLGGLYYRREMYELAIPHYKKVIRSNSKHYQGHYWLAMCYWKLQRYYAAINTLEEVVGLLPTCKDALNLMGACYEQIGEGAKAEHLYLKAISADPQGIVIHRLEGAEERRGEERVKH
jgi:tetratricopeptide (TPR) repeat protein